MLHHCLFSNKSHMSIMWTSRRHLTAFIGTHCGKFYSSMAYHKKWMPVAVASMTKLKVLPVTVPDGDNSSPSVPEGTGGPKSK